MMRTFRLARAAAWLGAACAALAACDSGTDPGPQPASISVSPNPLALPQLDSAQLIPIVYDKDGALISGVTVSFSSDDESVITVTKGGMAKSAGPAGTASITLSAGAATETVPVTVTAVRSSIAVSPNPVTIPQLTSLTLDAKVIDAVGAPVPTAALSYTSTNNQLFTVTSGGVITSVGPAGLANLIIEHDTLQTIVPVAITQVPTDIQISPSTVTLGVGGQMQLSAVVVDAVGTPVIGARVSYATSNPSRVTVSDDGLLQVVGGLGSAIITLTFGDLTKDITVHVVDVAHPSGSIAASPSIGSSPWGVAISNAGVVFVNNLSALYRASIDNPQFNIINPSIVNLSLAFSPSGTTLFASHDGGVQIIDVATNAEIGNVSGFTTNTVFSIALSPDGQTLAIGTSQSLHLMDVESRTIFDNFTTPGAVNALTFSSDGTRLYASQFTSDIVGEFNLTTRSHVRDIAAAGTPQGIAVSADGNTLFVAKEGTPSALEIIDLTNDDRQELSIGVGCFGLAKSPDQLEVWLACGNQVVAVDITSRSVRTSVTTGGFNRRIAFSTDGLTAVVTNENGSVYFIK